MALATATSPCTPPAPRCRTAIKPLYSTGISTRQIPVCSPTYCEGCQPGVGEWWVNSQSTLDKSQWIKGWCASQLFTRGLVQCEDNVLGTRSGGWWADAFRSDNFVSGSLLWTLQWRHVNNDTLTRAKQYAYDALRYLIGWGIAKTITIDALYVSRQVMQLVITVAGPGTSANFVVEGAAMPDQTYRWQVENPTPR